MIIYFIVCAFILFDVITGFCKALYQKKINSTILREGLFHKISEALALILAGGLEFSSNYFNLGFSVPLVYAVSGYTIIMETTSIIENLCEINPVLYRIFSKYLDKFKK